VTSLAAGGTKTLSFAWTPTVTGTHTLTGTAATVPGETDTADNVRTATSTVNPVPPTVSSITPNSMRVGTSGSVAVVGVNFANGATLTFQNGTGPTPTASNVLVVDSGHLTATVTVGTGTLSRNRLWDVVVTNPDGGRGTKVHAFTVTP
jgi:hypothetical protein